MVRTIFTALFGALVCLQSQAQVVSTPSPDQMVEQLKTPRTRSLRNLTVEEAQPSVNADKPVKVRPSLSLLIQFDFDSSTVRAESQQALVDLSTALQSEQLLSSRFAIEGHTDAQGRVAYNQKLSLQRAQAVVSFLKARGVGVSRLQAVGKGSSELANSAEPLAAENRRVRIVNLD